MHEIEKERGGQCLSDTYTNEASKLHWLCHRGHSWWARPANVAKGTWCPQCASLSRIRALKSRARRKYQVIPID